MRVLNKVGVAIAACLALGVPAVPAQAEIGPGADPETLTAAPVPTWQTNGTVWDVAVVNGVVYVGGNFTRVRPPGVALGGAGEVTRNRLAAFNAATGELLSWAPSATSTPFTPAGTPDTNCTTLSTGQVECATVWSIVPTPDNRSIVVGGDFQAINGSVRAGLAAIGVASGTLGVTTPGTLNTTFRPSVSGRIYSVAATNTGVWIGGSMTRAGGQTVTGLASFDFPSGAVRTAFNPAVVLGTTANTLTGVRKVVITADGSRLIVGGGFNSVAGRAIHGLQAISSANGAPAQWDSNRISNSAYVTNLKLYGGVLYSTAEANGTTSEGVISFTAATGAEQWYDGCRGASHSMALVRGVVYVGSHSHDCGAAEGGFTEQFNGWPEGDRRRYTLRAEVPNGAGAKLLPWTPRTNDGNGARDMEYDGTNLWVAGEFTSVDSAAQQGLTRFGFLGNGAQDRKPLQPSAPIVTSSRSGLVDISFQETEDPDNRRLVYQLYRDGITSNPAFTANASNPPWLKGWMQFQDAVAPGSTHTYDVRAIDPLGAQSSRSMQTSITAASASTPLANLARTDGAATQLSFESRVSGNYVDGISGKIATPGSGATSGTGNGVSGNALATSGSSSGGAVVTTREFTTRQFSVETMFKTGTTRGGSMVSFGSSGGTSSTGSSSIGLYMDDSGRLNFGLQPHGPRTGPWSEPSIQRRAVTTSGTYRDNAWHHVVATFQPGNGSRIFVDGNLAAEDPTMTYTMPVNAYMRIGGDYTSGFPNAPSSSWFAGTLDEVALYKYPLSAKQAAAHSNVVFQAPSDPDPIRVVSSGSVWKYNVSGAPQPSWAAATYDDSAWPSGPSQLGHGEGDEATAITPFMPDGTTRRITTYFRTAFDLPASPPVTGLSLRMKLDDGLILYLNGREVLRDNMPTGTVGPETLSTTWAADDGQTWRTVTIPAAALVGGRNVLAAEVHQNLRSSMDLTWDAELTARFN